MLGFSNIWRSGGGNICILPQDCEWERLAFSGHLFNLVSIEVYLVLPHLCYMKVAAKLSHLPKHEVSLNLGVAKLMCYSFQAIPKPLVTLWWSSDSLHLETSILISNTPSPMPLRAQIFNRPEIYFKKWRIHTLYFQITQILSEVSLVLLFSWVWKRKNFIFQENSSTWTFCFYLITSDSKWDLYFPFQEVRNTNSVSPHILLKCFGLTSGPQLLKPNRCMTSLRSQGKPMLSGISK